MKKKTYIGCIQKSEPLGSELFKKFPCLIHPPHGAALVLQPLVAPLVVACTSLFRPTSQPQKCFSLSLSLSRNKNSSCRFLKISLL